MNALFPFSLIPEDPPSATFEWEHTTQLLNVLNSTTDELMRSSQFFSFFAALTKDLPLEDFHKAIERFMALARSTFDDIGKDEDEGGEKNASLMEGGADDR